MKMPSNLCRRQDEGEVVGEETVPVLPDGETPGKSVRALHRQSQAQAAPRPLHLCFPLVRILSFDDDNMMML